MSEELFIERMNDFSDRLVAQASRLMNGDHDERLAGRILMEVAVALDDVFNLYPLDDCEGEA